MPRSASLDKYNAKRDFKKTAEPAGKVGRAKGHRFMVQKHDATRLHWDLRLEVGGVLKSWAVTRGPSLNPDDKRLAVRTEDHPLSYATFEGTIPKGEYGGGTVMLWDRGSWAPIAGKSAKDLDEGHLHFTLKGERMKGDWLLIRLKPRGKEKNENWLLRKIEDEFAGTSEELVERALTSVKTGRTMEEIAAGKKPPKSTKARNASPPAFQALQLATLVDHVPDGGEWFHETKYDGYRAQIAIGESNAKLYTRTGLDWSDKFPRLIKAAEELDVGSALLDGEIVVLDDAGKPNFSALQDAIKTGDPNALYMAFDLLWLEGKDLRALPNIERKERLRPLIPMGSIFHFAEHITGSGEKLFRAMCNEGLEGIISKRADAPYRGKRTQAWLKVKCVKRQEYVIVGWSESSAAKRGFGSLLMGVYEGESLQYAGRVGTGYNASNIDEIKAALDKIAVDKPPLEVPREARRGAHWVKPQLVAEVAYNDITADGILRHASFIALRRDKKAKDVVAETPQPVPDGDEVKISNPDRVIFPEAGITKGELADYYEAMAALVLTYAAGRPISLVRCPQGRGKQCFFQRHGAADLGDHIKTIEIDIKSGSRPYLYVEDATGLLETIQMGTIELHGWGAMAADIERPDRMIFDLDPDEGLKFEHVRKAAVELKTHLADLGLVSFPMLSGGKGLHVVVPLNPQANWPDVSDFARRFAEAVSQNSPEKYVATMSKAKRVGKIFIDWLRNQRTSTAVLPYSARAREGAPVAAPIAWSELDDYAGGNAFSIRDWKKLQQRASSQLLAGWGRANQTLPGH